MALVVAAMSCSFYVACGDDDVIIGNGGSAGTAGRGGTGGTSGAAGTGGASGSAGTGGTSGAAGTGGTTSVDEPDAGDAGFVDAGNDADTSSDE
jgi:hypothetical protein